MKPEEYERLLKYFNQLNVLIPNPPKDWEKNMKPCKWLKILKENKNKTSGARR